MRFPPVSVLRSLVIIPLLGLAVFAQEEKPKSEAAPAKPAAKSDAEPAPKPNSKTSNEPTAKRNPAAEKVETAPKAKSDAESEKPSDSPPKEKKPNKPSENKKADKPESDSSETSSEAKEKKEQPKAISKPSKPEPPEKKPLPNIGSLKNPQIPGQTWRIHDLKRPRPKAVAPGVVDNAPPADAIVLFDGENLDQWYHIGSEDETYEAQWKVQDGYFEVEPRTGSLLSIESFGSCQLHIEWMIPKGITGASQGRGNSGIKLMERYEIQVLDSFKNITYADGQAGSIYGQFPPLVNAVRQQGEWQTYEIIFEAPIYEAGKMKRPPIATVFLNGILVQNHRELAGPTGLRGSAQEEVPPAAPIMLQDHGNRIRFRNIWIRELSSS